MIFDVPGQTLKGNAHFVLEEPVSIDDPGLS
jgi:hypothetical protein